MPQRANGRDHVQQKLWRMSPIRVNARDLRPRLMGMLATRITSARTVIVPNAMKGCMCRLTASLRAMAKVDAINRSPTVARGRIRTYAAAAVLGTRRKARPTHPTDTPASAPWAPPCPAARSMAGRVATTSAHSRSVQRRYRASPTLTMVAASSPVTGSR